FRFRPIAAGATTGWALYPCWEPPDSQPCTCRTDNNPEDDCVREMRRERSWQQPPVQPCRPRACVSTFLPPYASTNATSGEESITAGSLSGPLRQPILPSGGPQTMLRM